jgi:hypothetical protein
MLHSCKLGCMCGLLGPLILRLISYTQYFAYGLLLHGAKVIYQLTCLWAPGYAFLSHSLVAHVMCVFFR